MQCMQRKKTVMQRKRKKNSGQTCKMHFWSFFQIDKELIGYLLTCLYLCSSFHSPIYATQTNLLCCRDPNDELINKEKKLHKTQYKGRYFIRKLQRLKLIDILKMMNSMLKIHRSFLIEISSILLLTGDFYPPQYFCFVEDFPLSFSR